MSGALTPLELRENAACHAIALEVACQFSPAVAGTYAAGWVAAANEIEHRIADRATSRAPGPDPFRACAYPGCDAECLGPFCRMHSALLPRSALEVLMDAVAEDDRQLYGMVLTRAIAAIRARQGPG